MEYKEANLIDRLSIDLDTSQKAKLNIWIENKKQSVSQDRTRFIERQKKYLPQYDDFITYNRKGLWEGCFLPGTTLLTKDGWRPVEEMALGDMVYSKNPENGETAFIPVLEVQNYASSPGAVRFKNQRIDITVTSGHRMYLVDDRGGKYPNRHKFTFAKKLSGKNTRHWMIPRSGEPLKGGTVSVPDGIAPEDWFAFMGWYIAEGCVCKGSGGSWIQIAQVKKANPEKHAEIDQLLSRMPFRYLKRDRYFNVKVGHDFADKLEMGGAFGKYIPREMLEAPVYLLEIMFDALMKGDGNVAKKGSGHRRYGTVSRQLADDVQELITRCGRWATILYSKTSHDNTFYTVSEHIKKTSSVFDMSVTDVDYSGPCYCVSNKWGVVYARSNDKPMFIGQSANYHMPLTLIMVNSYVAKLYNIISSGDMTNYTPREGTDEKFVEPLKKLRDWYMWDYLNNYRGIKGVAYELCQDVSKVGFGLLLKTWELKQRKTIEIVENELHREMADMDPQVKELAAGLSDPMEISENKIDTTPYKEIEKIVTVFEGTKLLTVPFENAYFPNDIPESSNMDHPECVILSTEMKLSEINLRVEQGEFDPDAALKAQGESYVRNPSHYEEDVKEIRDTLTGYDATVSSYTNEIRNVEYCFCTYDIDDDGIAEELVVTRTDQGTILKVTYLDRISRSGIRPVFKFDCFSKERQAYSRGVIEYMYPLNEEMDMNHNMRQDYMQLQTCPFFAYRSSSPLDKNQVRISPGKGIPVDDVNQDIRMLNFNSNIGPLFQEENYLWELGNRVARVSPASQGQVQGPIGAQRSTSGVVTLLRQMDLEFRPIVEQFALNWKKLEKSILEDLDYRVDPILKARILGPTVEKAFQSEGDFNSIFRVTAMLDMKIDVASIVNSDEMKRNDAQIFLQLMNTPGLAHQMGIINQDGIYGAWKNWMTAHGFDSDMYLHKPQGVTDPLSLWQEIQIIYQGEMPPMAMTDDHAKKAQDLQAFSEDEAFQMAQSKGLMVANALEVLMQAVGKHMELAKALQAQQGMANPTGENGQNQNELMTGNAPQQGGQDANKTTSRELGGNSGGGEGGEPGGQAPQAG